MNVFLENTQHNTNNSPSLIAKAKEVLRKAKSIEAKRADKVREVHVNDAHNTIIVVKNEISDKEAIGNFLEKRAKYKA